LGSATWNVKVIKEPTPHTFLDPVTKSLKEGYRGQSIFEVSFSLPPEGVSRLPTQHKIPVLIDFQSCNKELCLLPATLRIDVPLVRSESQSLHGDSTRSSPSLFSDTSAKLKDLLDSGALSWMSFLLLFVAGLVTAATPCVYPLYPITAGIFFRWTSRSIRKTLCLSLTYCIGMTISYALLGLLTASTGALFGSLAQSPAFLLSIGFFILLSAVFFSGLLPFQAPQFLQNIFMGPAGESHSEKTFLALLPRAFSMGLGLGVVAAPCVGPVLIALLAWLSSQFAAGHASYAQGFFLLASFGAGMSLPLLVMSTLIVRLNALPSLGKYTPWAKHLGSLLLVAGSLFFIVPGLQLLGVGAPKKVEAKFKVYSLETWPRNQWSVLDFRANWCSACLELENETFTHHEVSALFENKSWDYVSVDLTDRNPTNQKIAADWNVIGLPTVLILNPQGQICDNLTLNGFEDARAFKKRLESAATSCLPKH
jgi:thiol:disulfide interchange protein DsbD